MPDEKSRFITIVAWGLILVSSWNGINTALYLFADPDTSILAQHFSETPLVWFAMSHSKTINVALFILSVATLFGAIGLLWSKHWARVVLIVVLPIGVLYNIFEILINLEMLKNLSEMSMEEASRPLSNFDDQHDTMELAVRLGFWLLIVLNIGISLLYIWIVKRLMHNR